MKKSLLIETLTFFFLIFLIPGHGKGQTYNDGLIEYDVLLSGNTDTTTARLFHNAYMVLYIRGNQTRSDLHTGLGTTTTINDEKKGNTIILNEYGSQRVMVRLSADQYKLVNKKYSDPVLTELNEKKTILGFQCRSAQLKFSDGTSFLVYYTPDLKFQTTYNGLPVIVDGFPFEYESDMGGIKVIYRIRNIKKEAVSVNLFKLPEEGYREIKFEEIYKQ